MLGLLALVVGERPGRRGWAPPPADAPAITVYVVYDGFHSDLMAPRAAIHAYGRDGVADMAASRLAPSPFVYFGWGDALFYKGDGFTLARGLDLIRAALPLQNESTVHVQRGDDLRRPPAGWRAVSLQLSPTDFSALVRRLDAAFLLEGGAPVFPPGAATPEQVFYRGRGSASMFNECNQWIGALFGAAGARRNVVLDTTSWGLVLDLRLRAGAEPTRSPTF